MDDFLGGLFGGGKKEIAPELQDRLPPGQTLVEDWPVLTYGATPDFDPATWTFEVTGLVENPMSWTYEEFMALPAADVHCDIHCVTHWSRFDNTFTGVLYSVIEAAVRPKPEAVAVMQSCDGGYTTNVLVEDLRSDDVVLAYKHDGAPLTREHGAPLRMVIPNRYFWKSAKFLRGLEFLGRDRPGFWEQYGYHNHGDPWTEQRYS